MFGSVRDGEMARWRQTSEQVFPNGESPFYRLVSMKGGTPTPISRFGRVGGEDFRSCAGRVCGTCRTSIRALEYTTEAAASKVQDWHVCHADSPRAVRVAAQVKVARASVPHEHMVVVLSAALASAGIHGPPATGVSCRFLPLS
jgi:hypothetical protein